MQRKCSWGSGAFEGRPGNADSAAEAAGAGTGGEGGQHLRWDPCGQIDRRLNQHRHPSKAMWQTDRWEQRSKHRIISRLHRTLVNLWQRLTSRCLRPGNVAAVSLAGEHGGEGSTHSLSAAGEDSGGCAPGFFCVQRWDKYEIKMFGLVFCVCLYVYACRCISTWSAGESCGAALPEAAAGWGIAGVRPEVGMEALAHPGTEGLQAGQWGVDGVPEAGGWPGRSEGAGWHVLEGTRLRWAPGERPGESVGRR